MRRATFWVSATIVTLWLVLVLGLFVAQGRAGQFGPGRPFGAAETLALSQAEAYWQRQPTLCLSRTLEVVAPGALQLDVPVTEGDILARATQPEDDVGAVPCGMWVEEDTLLQQNLCSVLRHEYAHWLGFKHEDPELAEMPGCVEGSTEASGGIYDPVEVARHQAWEEWREWRAVCRRARGTYRPRCWHQLKRRAASIRKGSF